ncbi:MAG: hypothetical protein ABEI31_10130 [Halodesulfurarchaeum sp.]
MRSRGEVLFRVRLSRDGTPFQALDREPHVASTVTVGGGASRCHRFDD